MSEAIQEGDLVHLRGAHQSVPMSVQAITDDGKFAVCMWFSAEGVLQEKAFLIRTLERSERGVGVVDPDGDHGAGI